MKLRRWLSGQFEYVPSIPFPTMSTRKAGDGGYEEERLSERLEVRVSQTGRESYGGSMMEPFMKTWKDISRFLQPSDCLQN